MLKKLKLSVIFMTILFAGLVITQAVLAQMTGVLVYPNVLDVDFSKDNQKFHSKAVFVENPTNKKIRIRAYLTSWKYDEESGMKFLDQPDQYSLNDCIKFFPREFDLAPGQKQMVRITTKLPDGVDGEYRSVIFFETVTAKEELLKPDKSKVNVVVTYKTRYGVTLYAYKGLISKNAEIKDFTFQKIANNPYLLVTLLNTGNIHTNVEGEISILDNNDQPLMKVEAPRYSVFPGETQKMKIQLPEKDLKAGDYRAQIRLTYKNLEEKEEVLEAKTSFNYDSIKISNINQPQKPVVEEEVKKTPDNIAKPLFFSVPSNSTSGN